MLNWTELKTNFLSRYKRFIDEPWLYRLDNQPNYEQQQQLKEPIQYADTALRRPKKPAKRMENWAKGWNMYNQARIPDNTRCQEYLAIREDLSTFQRQMGERKSKNEAKLETNLKDKLKEAKADFASMPASFNHTTIVGWMPWLVWVPLGFMRMIFGLSFYISLFFPIPFYFLVYPFIYGLESIIQDPMEYFTAITIIIIGTPLGCAVLYALFRLLYELVHIVPEKWIGKSRIIASIRRDKGVIVFYRKNRVTHEVPFDEVETFITSMPQPNGGLPLISLIITDQRNPASFVVKALKGEGITLAQDLNGPLGTYRLAIWWEIWQHFMDVSRPLPDIPMFEPYRHLDPTTIAWDKKHNRPPRLWRDMDPDVYLKMESESWKVAKNYPFTDESKVKELGWKPAGDGKHWYQMG